MPGEVEARQPAMPEECAWPRTTSVWAFRRIWQDPVPRPVRGEPDPVPRPRSDLGSEPDPVPSMSAGERVKSLIAPPSARHALGGRVVQGATLELDGRLQGGRGGGWTASGSRGRAGRGARRA